MKQRCFRTPSVTGGGAVAFFQDGAWQYGEGDKFLRIKVPVTSEVVKACWQQTSFDELEECIRSEYHELRLDVLLTFVQIFTHARKDVALQQQCVDFYLGHTEFINNLDLVDLCCYEILDFCADASDSRPCNFSSL